MAPSYPQGSWFEQTWISCISGSFHINLSFSGLVFLEKKIFKDCSYIILCKTLIPYCVPIVPSGVMIWTNLNLHYIRKLPHNSQLSWPSGSWEKDFQMTPPYFCMFVIISPLKWAQSFIWTNLNPQCLRNLSVLSDLPAKIENVRQKFSHSRSTCPT